MLVPSHEMRAGELDAFIPQLQDAVHERTRSLFSDGSGLRGEFVRRDIGPGIDLGQDGGDGGGNLFPDTTVPGVGRPALGRHIRKLSKTDVTLVEDLKQLAKERMAAGRAIGGHQRQR